MGLLDDPSDMSRASSVLGADEELEEMRMWHDEITRLLESRDTLQAAAFEHYSRRALCGGVV